MIKRRCEKCGKLFPIEEKSFYCEEHRSKPFQYAQRSNQGSYQTAEWRDLRNKIIRRSGACRSCGATDSLQVHHIIPPRGNRELFYDENNLIVLCAQCHRYETQKEITGRGITKN